MSSKPIVYANQEMLDRISKIESQMVSGTEKGRPSTWQLTGEVNAKARPINSLLAEHLDFNTVSKLPPTITQEKSTTIEAMIKQRILDELFDDPIRRYVPSGKKGKTDEEQGFDFTKSKKGLGELYEDDYRKKLLASDPNAFLLSGNDLTGADAGLKKEITTLMRGLFFQLDSLSNLHFTPRPVLSNEAGISTQNVPSLMIEDALPIAVSTGQSKSAREVFSVNA